MRPAFYFPDTPPLPLPAGHRFPADKYQRLRATLIGDGMLADADLTPAPIATDAELTTVHDAGYVTAIATGDVAPAIMRAIGLPWSPVLARRSRATVGGTLAAARRALATGFSAQLAGGTHHAHRDRGSGFCTFNDFAVTAHVLLGERRVARLAILDVDVHQGDGNAALLSGDARVFVASIHGAKNFPFDKQQSDLDIALDDGTDDAGYTSALRDAIEAVLAFRPDLLLVNAGVDPLSQDRLGRLALTHDGLVARDRAIFAAAHAAGIPVTLAIGGGYADPISLTVDAYANTFRAARKVYGF